jgi:hypothetical protein
MNCYQCGQPPVGACVACGEFYCAEHCRRLCLDCYEARRAFAVRLAIPATFVLLVGGLILLTMIPLNPTTMLLGVVAVAVGCVMTVLVYKMASRRFP